MNKKLQGLKSKSKRLSGSINNLLSTLSPLTNYLTFLIALITLMVVFFSYTESREQKIKFDYEQKIYSLEQRNNEKIENLEEKSNYAESKLFKIELDQQKVRIELDQQKKIDERQDRRLERLEITSDLLKTHIVKLKQLTERIQFLEKERNLISDRIARLSTSSSFYKQALDRLQIRQNEYNQELALFKRYESVTETKIRHFESKNETIFAKIDSYNVLNKEIVRKLGLLSSYINKEDKQERKIKRLTSQINKLSNQIKDKEKRLEQVIVLINESNTTITAYENKYGIKS